MPQDLTFDAAGFVRLGIEELRRSLLDFSTRNRLLSFKHSERGTDFIRAVDELPGEVYRRLNGGKMRFKSLPDHALAPPDEASAAFGAVLRELRASDEDYLRSLADAPEDAEPTFEVERSLRDKVRVKLGLEPLLRKGKLDLAVFAKAHGIEPGYELSEVGTETSDSRRDKYIQTLFLQDDLERRARKLDERYQDHLQEKGINVLHAAFGFLEWVEDDASETCHHAPLLLLPLSMSRKTEPGRVAFELSGEGADLEVNATLFEFLKKEFHITLPLFAANAENGEPPSRGNGAANSDPPTRSGADDAAAMEEWLKEVAKVTKGKRRWCVRRFVTIGTFPFSRISLFKDLDASSWSDDELVTHDVVARLLGGRGRYDDAPAEGAGDDYPLDAPEFAGKVPSIILDADSSQHSAIVDALNGHSLVIQGPPGTGKSQTIANTIAAAIDAGKRVLFLAEKSAALNVVASRLRRCGLGPFLLELHSDKARKSDVIASLKERLELPQANAPGDLERKLEQRRASRGRLGRYVALMGEPVGRLGRPLQQLMWYATRHGAELDEGLPTGLDKVRVPKAVTVDQHALDGVREALDGLAAARDALIRASGSVAQHPWHGTGSTNPFASEDITASASQAHAALKNLAEEIQSVGEPAPPECGADLQTWLEEISRIPELAGDQHLICMALSTPEALAEVGDLLDRYRAVTARLGEMFTDVAAVESGGLASLLAECSDLGVAASHRALAEAAAQADADGRRLGGYRDEIQRLCRRLGLDGKLSTEQELALVETLLLLRETSVEALSARTPEMRVEASDLLIANARGKAHALRRREADLRERCDLARAKREYSVEGLYRYSDALSDSGILAVIRPEARRANKTWKRLTSRAGKADRSTRANELRAIAEHMAEVRAFNDNAQLQSLIGPAFAGHETDFDLISQAARFLRQTSATMGQAGPALSRTHKLFIEGDAHALGALGEKLQPEVLERLRDTLAEMRETGETLQDRLDAVQQRLAKLESAQGRAKEVGVAAEAELKAKRGADGEWLLVKDVDKWGVLGSHLVKLKGVLGDSFEALLASTAPLKSALAIGRAIDQCRLSMPILSELRRTLNPEGRRKELASVAARLGAVLTVHRSAWSEFVAIAQLDEEAFLGARLEKTTFAEVAARLLRALEEEFSLGDWMRYRKARLAAANSRGALVADAFDGADRPEPRLADVFELCLARTLVRQQLGGDAKDLAELSGSTLEDARARFSALDKEITELEAKRIAASVQRRPIEYGNDRGPKSEWTDGALIHNEVSKRRRHLPISDVGQAGARGPEGDKAGLADVTTNGRTVCPAGSWLLRLGHHRRGIPDAPGRCRWRRRARTSGDHRRRSIAVATHGFLQCASRGRRRIHRRGGRRSQLDSRPGGRSVAQKADAALALPVAAPEPDRTLQQAVLRQPAGGVSISRGRGNGPWHRTQLHRRQIPGGRD